MTSVALAMCMTAFGGQPPAPPQPPVPSPAEKPAEKTQPAPASATTPPPTPQPPAMPSLDDVLGLAKPSDQPKQPGTGEAKPRLPDGLDRALQGETESNELERAVALMDQSAKRLEAAKDTSLETQRMQEETVRLLDALVKKGNKKNNPQNKPQSKPQDKDQQQQQQPNQSQQSQSDPQQQQQAAAQTNDSVDRGGNTNARLRPGIDAARAAWGNLPQRVRQLLMQGSGDQFSKEYQRMTEEYYKRLGEGGSGR